MMNPQLNPPCSRPDAVPRRCVGQCSSASGMPAAHSPPMPIPNSARNANSMAYDVEKPDRNANSENHAIDSMSGSLRPQRSAAAPASAPPSSRKSSVTVPSAPASAASTVKLFWMSIRMKVRIVKSKPSRTQPRNAAQNAFHCLRSSCRYQGLGSNGSPGSVGGPAGLTRNSARCGWLMTRPLYTGTRARRAGTSDYAPGRLLCRGGEELGVVLELAVDLLERARQELRRAPGRHLELLDLQ